MIVKKVDKYAKYLHSISGRMTDSQRSASKEMLENILNDLIRLQRKNELLIMQSKGVKSEDYISTLEKSIDLLILLGFDMMDISLIEKKTLDFMHNNIKSIHASGEITAKRILNIANLIKTHEQINGIFPESMNELKETYKSVVDGR